ncbi:MAG: LLM class F420-dependent oxidoreductase [Roseiflexaceae bacterium]
MMTISIMIEGQMGLTWPRWKALAAEVEALGFAGLFRSDHFTNPAPPDHASLEALTSLTYLAGNTERMHFGPLVSPVSFRDAVMLARQAAAIDDLSGGRFLLGLGAGWQDREHQMYGYSLGDVETRFARLTEALELTTRLYQSDAPVTFEGRFYQLREAVLLPRPLRPGGPTILIGGNGPRRTLPLVARYAQVWNAVGLTPEEFKERSALLDTLLVQQGRRPEDVRRTMMTSQIVAPDRPALEQALRRRAPPDKADLPFDELLAFHQGRGWYRLIGTPEQISAQLRDCAAAGISELMLQWFDLDDLEALRSFAHTMLPLAQEAGV